MILEIVLTIGIVALGALVYYLTRKKRRPPPVEAAVIEDWEHV
jgi:hypothetical protein